MLEKSVNALILSLFFTFYAFINWLNYQYDQFLLYEFIK